MKWWDRFLSSFCSANKLTVTRTHRIIFIHIKLKNISEMCDLLSLFSSEELFQNVTYVEMKRIFSWCNRAEVGYKYGKEEVREGI